MIKRVVMLLIKLAEPLQSFNDLRLKITFLDMSESGLYEIFKEFAERSQQQLGDSLKKIILYGSVARGEDTEDSDIDIFAIVESKEDLEKLRDLAFDFGVLENGVSISVQGRVEEDFKGFSSNSFLRNVERDGVEYA
jgi:predicted nucleotidyltransferase